MDIAEGLLDSYHNTLENAVASESSGRVLRVTGLTIISSGPAVSTGSLCEIHGSSGVTSAVVSGFKEGECTLQPLGTISNVNPGDKVIATGHDLEVPVGPSLIGRVIDALGNPIDGKGEIKTNAKRSVNAEPPSALGRRHITDVLETGIKVIDSLFTIGKGQRIGIFAGSGVGKSTLLGELAKNAKADVNVIALVGERGREVSEFIDKVLGPEGMKNTIVIVSTSDRPAVERAYAAMAAHSIAEHFRDAGLDVLLMMDSLTRFCQAQRDIGLSSGEPPAMRGYPPSAFALLPKLLERSGTSDIGSITGIYSVLIEGDDENDPVADNSRAILDGHLFLSRELAGRNIYPSIDPTLSVSRLIVDLATKEEYELASFAGESWGEYERIKDLVEVGAYVQGSNPKVDMAIQKYPDLVDFIKQGLGEVHSRSESLNKLSIILEKPIETTPIEEEVPVEEEVEQGKE